MLEQLKGINLKGANFVNQTKLDLFNSTNDKVVKAALIYGKMALVRVLFLMPSKKVKGEDILNIETASLYDNDLHEISINDSEDKAIFVF